MNRAQMMLLVADHGLHMRGDSTGIYNDVGLAAIVYEDENTIIKMSIVPAIPDNQKNFLKTLGLIHGIKTKYLGKKGWD